MSSGAGFITALAVLAFLLLAFCVAFLPYGGSDKD
jgi:hypothetical protein